MSNKNAKGRSRIPFEKDELIELMWIDLCAGVSRYQIMLKLDRDAYTGYETSKLSQASKYKYLQLAYSKCEGELQEEREKLRDLFYSRFLSVYEEAMENRDRQNAIRALDLASKIAGVYAEEKKDITLRGDIKATINFGIGEEENKEENED